MRLDSFVIAIRLHKLPHCCRVIVRAGPTPIILQEILDGRNNAIVAAERPVLAAEKGQIEGELIPEGQDGMIIAGRVLVFLETQLRPEDGGPQQGRGDHAGVVAGSKGGEGERGAVGRVA